MVLHYYFKLFLHLYIFDNIDVILYNPLKKGENNMEVMTEEEIKRNQFESNNIDKDSINIINLMNEINYYSNRKRY